MFPRRSTTQTRITQMGLQNYMIREVTNACSRPQGQVIGISLREKKVENVLAGLQGVRDYAGLHTLKNTVFSQVFFCQRLLTLHEVTMLSTIRFSQAVAAYILAGRAGLDDGIVGKRQRATSPNSKVPGPQGGEKLLG